MDAGVPNTSTKSTGDIAVLQPSDQKPNQYNVNSDTAMSQLVHTGLMCSEESQRCGLSQLSARPYLKDIINNLKKSDARIANNFISSIDNDKEHVVHSKSDNIEIMINDEADEVIKNFLIHLKIHIKII